MYAYCNNNPVNMCDCSGTCPHNGIVVELYSLDCFLCKLDASEDSFSWANHVKSIHETAYFPLLNLGTWWGKIGVSTTIAKQDEEPGLFYSFSDIGNDEDKYGVGINAKNWLGLNGGYSSNDSIFIGGRITPWVHGEVSLGLDGIGFSLGLDICDTSYDLEVKAGWGTILIFLAPELSLAGGILSGATS